jgi:hypothetical protein
LKLYIYRHHISRKIHIVTLPFSLFHASLPFFLLTNFFAAYLLPLPLFRYMPSAVILTQSSSHFHLIKFRSMNQKVLAFSSSPVLCHLVQFVRIECVLCVESEKWVDVMETLHINGQSIKIVDRKSYKRDNSGEKLSFEKKVYQQLVKPSDNEVENEVKSGGSHKIRRKCPREIEIPHKRRILKRPRRFKTYYSDRKPLPIPRFSFPRCLTGNY